MCLAYLWALYSCLWTLSSWHCMQVQQGNMVKRCLLEETKKDFQCFQHCHPVMVTRMGCWRALTYSWIHLWPHQDHLSVQDSKQPVGVTGSPGRTSSSWEIPAPPARPLHQFPVGTKLITYRDNQRKSEEKKASSTPMFCLAGSHNDTQLPKLL